MLYEVITETDRDAGGEHQRRRLTLDGVRGEQGPVQSKAVTIYELLGAKNEARVSKEAVETYEKAFAAYLARDFDEAIAITRPYVDVDPPSAVLIERCRVFRNNFV